MKLPFKLLIALLCMTNVLCWAQKQKSHSPSSMAYLEQQFPQLTNLYRPELENMHTHYIFAVDVSGSMIKYDTIVTPALKAFTRALPNGETVTVIPFGTEAKQLVPGLAGVKIQGEGTKRALETALSTLYANEGYDKIFKANTNILEAVKAVNNTLRNNDDINMNVIVIITDFLNDLPGEGEVPLNSGNLIELQTDYERLTDGDGKHTRLVAMKLPKIGTGRGYSLDQLKEEVYFNTTGTRKFDIVDVISDQGAIKNWFDQLTRDIMTEKLRAVIDVDNRMMNPTLNTEIDIDGNTLAEIHWKPNKLYTQISIDSTYTNPDSKFIFKNNRDSWQITTDTVIKNLKLGKLQYKNWGLHHYDEPLNLGVSLPTAYDDELNKLNVDKPIPNTSEDKSGWLWTFWLPFWICVGIVIILIIYLILVAMAAKRNALEKFSGKIEFYDSKNLEAREPAILKNKTGSITIGENGNNGCVLSKGNPKWDIEIKKGPSNPFKFWEYPYFIWRQKNGYVRKGKSNHGKIGSFDKNNVPKRIALDCGTDSDHITHNIIITVKKNK